MAKELRIDPYQKEAIKTLNNAIVMAGAGSGKTMVLAERYLYLVVEKKILPEEILTLTFTQKAASEMYQRIFQNLSQSPEIEAQNAAAHFDTASISTIDAFCGEIARAGSFEFGLPAQFQYQNMLDFAKQESLNFLIQSHDNKIIEDLIYTFGFKTIWEDFLSLLCLNHFYLTSSINFKNMFSKQIEQLKILLQTHLQSWQKVTDILLDLEGTQSTLTNCQEAIKNIKLQEHISKNQFQKALEELKNLKMRKPGKVSSESLVLLKDLIDEIRDLQNQLIRILAFIDKEDDLMDLAGGLQPFYSEYINKKRNTLQTDFNDIAYLARDILLKDRDIRQYYKNKFKYIMIDEFQDNNQLQKDLLYLIAEKKNCFSKSIPKVEDLESHKLYFVGDEKQSIYRFRKADVSVFKGLKSELEHIGGKAINLLYNYRSEPGLIHFFNQLFPSVFGSGDKDFEAQYQSLKAKTVDQPIKPEIHFLYKAYEADKKTDLNDKEIEAYNLAKHLSEVIKNKTLQIRRDGQIEAAEFSDIALLLRSTSNQNVYEKMFRLFNIPYHTENIRSLFLEAPMYDFYSILQLANDPHDTLAYAAYLRSPFVNLEDISFTELLKNSNELFYIYPQCPEEEKQKIIIARELFEKIESMCDVSSINNLVSYLWHEGGYRYFILSQPQNHHYLEFYDYIQSMTRQADQKQEGLDQFLQKIHGNLGQVVKQDDLKIFGAQNPGVAILSVHRSKGLEFPVVIVADMGNSGNNRGESNAPFYYHKDYGITLNWGEGNYFSHQAKEQTKEEENAEIKRLFYVALTRAQYHLILSGTHNQRNRSSQNVFLNLLLQGLNQLAENDKSSEDFIIKQEEIFPIDQAQLRQKNFTKTPKKIPDINSIYKGLPVIRRKYFSHEIPVTALTEIHEKQIDKNQFENMPRYPIDKILSTTEQHAAFGTQVHYLISQSLLNPDKPGDWLPEVQSLFPKAQQSLALGQAREFAQMALTSGLDSYLQTPQKWESEFAFLLKWDREPQVIFKGIIDFLTETDDKIIIIDFKTDIFYNKESYAPQLTIYARAAEEIFSKPAEVYLLPIRAKRLDHVTCKLEDQRISSLIESLQEQEESP